MTEVAARREPRQAGPQKDPSLAYPQSAATASSFADFLVNTFGSSYLKQGPILDVAGGKGDLSWVLANAYGLDSIVRDPCVTDHSKLRKQRLGSMTTSHGARVHRGSEL